ncbi:zinc finger protein 593-like [Limulus polyphemus]|uniref:Zinc finger protein 593-like n=1 Tax=Limulus polyphemus TaxID=6850 RepID=A0ABM1BG95_LIMPO|nr:zinc finger protein 593-like [Limulus polyphemus]
MTRYSRKKTNRGKNPITRKCKTRKRTKDLDEISEHMKIENASKLLNQEEDYDLPGSGQFYCLHCARYFIDDHALKEHFRSKVHKRRLKALEEEPYSQREAEAAAGMGCYVPPKRRKVQTQPQPDANLEEGKESMIESIQDS